jgi:outer membrane protein TolC
MKRWNNSLKANHMVWIKFKNNSLNVGICTFMLLLMTSKTGSAQIKLTLKDAISKGLGEAYSLQQNRILVENAKLRNSLGFSGALPTISGGISQNGQMNSIRQELLNGTIIDRRNALSQTFNANALLNLTLYNGGRIKNTKLGLQSAELLATLTLTKAQIDVAANIALGFYDLMRKKALKAALEKTVEVSREKLKVVQLREKVGLMPSLDVYQAEVELNTNELLLADQQLIIEQAEIELKRLLQIPQNDAIVLDGKIEVDSTLTFTQMESAILKNPDVDIASELTKAAGYQAKQIEALRMPTLGFSANYTFNRNQNQAGFSLLSQSLGPSAVIGLNIPIYAGNTLQRNAKIAQQQVKIAGINEQQVKTNQEAALAKLFSSYKNEVVQTKKQQRNFELSQQLLDGNLKRLNANQITLSDFTETQRSYEVAAYNLFNHLYLGKVAEIELKRLSGITDF